MWRMACRWDAVHWTLRLARALVWFFRETSPTVSAASLSFTALTQTSTCRPKPCPATLPQPATCEYYSPLCVSEHSNQPTFTVGYTEALKSLHLWDKCCFFSSVMRNERDVVPSKNSIQVSDINLLSTYKALMCATSLLLKGNLE